MISREEPPPFAARSIRASRPTRDSSRSSTLSTPSARLAKPISSASVTPAGSGLPTCMTMAACPAARWSALPSAAARRRQGRQGADHRRLQGRPADAVAGGFRQDRRHSRRPQRFLRLGDAAVQHHDLHGASDPQHAALLRPVRARDRQRAHPRQDRGLKTQGHVDGRQRAAGL